MNWKDIINNLRRPDTQKIQLMIAIKLISSKDNDQENIMHSKVNNIEVVINVKADEVIEELFKSLEKRYQIGLEISTRFYLWLCSFIV